MKKGSKRLWTMLLAAGVLTGTISGCSTESPDKASDNGEDVRTVSIHLSGSGDFSDAQTVEDAMNEISVPEYGIRFDLNYIEFGNYAQQSSLLLTGNDVDIFQVNITPFATFVKNGQLYDITEFYENASDEFKNNITELDPDFDETTKATTVNGKLYALPRVGTCGTNTCFVVADPFATEYGIEGGEVWTLDDVDTFLEWAHEKYPDKYALVPQGPGLMMSTGWTWDSLGDDSMIGIIDAFGTDMNVHNLYEDEEFLRLCEYTRSWYEKGYMMQDCLSNTEASTTLYTGAGISSFNAGMNNETDYELKAGGSVMKVVFLTGDKMVTSSASGTCYGISANTEDPETAWEAMELIYAHPEISELFKDGIEGVHYELDEEGIAVYPEGKDSTNVGYNGVFEKWNYPNQFIGADPYVGSRYGEVLREYKETTVQTSPAFGFCFDSEPVVDAYTTCANIMSKYTQALLMGAVDPDEIIPQANEELQQAGIDEVIQEKQSQLDEWLANQ